MRITRSGAHDQPQFMAQQFFWLYHDVLGTQTHWTKPLRGG
jgi:hypothetical protein